MFSSSQALSLLLSHSLTHSRIESTVVRLGPLYSCLSSNVTMSNVWGLSHEDLEDSDPPVSAPQALIPQAPAPLISQPQVLEDVEVPRLQEPDPQDQGLQDLNAQPEPVEERLPLTQPSVPQDLMGGERVVRPRRAVNPIYQPPVLLPPLHHMHLALPRVAPLRGDEAQPDPEPFHGNLLPGARCFITLVVAGRLEVGGPEVVFENIYEGRNEDFMGGIFPIHPRQGGTGHYRWLPGHPSLLRRTQRQTHIAQVIERLLRFYDTPHAYRN